MEIKELKKKNVNELQQLLSDSREKLRDLRFKDANKQLKNVRQIRQLRIMIARILTLMNSKKTTSQQTTGQSAEK